MEKFTKESFRKIGLFNQELEDASYELYLGIVQEDDSILENLMLSKNNIKKTSLDLLLENDMVTCEDNKFKITKKYKEVLLACSALGVQHGIPHYFCQMRM
ncbi:MAG: hypothetical protein RSB67_02665 [Clostridia bacterium]